MSVISRTGVVSSYDTQPRYDLGAEEVENITTSFLDAESADLPDGRFVGVLVDAASPIANVGRTTERQVLEETFPGNDATFMHREYGRYENASHFLMVLDRRKRVAAGVMRVIVDSEVSSKSLVDSSVKLGKSIDEIREYHGIRSGEKTWDIATLAVPQEYRGHARQGVQTSLMLYRMFNTLGTQEGVQHVVAIIDEKALRAVKAIGVPFKAMCGVEDGFEYLDSAKSFAVYGSLPEFQPGVAKQGKELRGKTRFRDISQIGIERFIKRRLIASAAGNLASGKGLDGHISLPVA